MAITKVSRNLLSTGVSDSSDATAITIDSSEKVGIGTTTPSQILNVEATSTPVIEVSTLDDNNPASASAIDLVEKQPTHASNTATFGQAGVYGYRIQLNGSDNTLRIKSGSQTTITDRLTIERDTGNVTLDTGNLIIGTSGKGIDFSATGDGSGTDSSEVFDDYEEGTWTPTFAGVALSALYGATYIKIGRQVIAECYFAGNTQNNTNQFQVAGLPYTSANETTYGGGSIGYVGSRDLSELAAPIIAPNSNYVYFHYIDGSQSGANVTNNVIWAKENNNLLFLAQFIYRAAS
ncbi:MAG: hypothetical protein CM15mV44_0140 [uncultured marine virus]|nr:MAG: hypothetical protein CM15mV44_0140 [uncultured marine virus]